LTRRFCALLDRLGGRRVHHSFLPRDRQEDRFISAGAFTCRAIDKPAGDCADVAPWASTDPTQHRSVCTPSSPVAPTYPAQPIRRDRPRHTAETIAPTVSTPITPDTVC
jgi:hypothetical protein